MTEASGEMPPSKVERRWVILAPDGKYVTVGRSTDPTEMEIHHAEELMSIRGKTGWLAIMEGNPHAGSALRLMEVRPLAGPTTSFASAAAACVAAIEALRQPVTGAA